LRVGGESPSPHAPGGEAHDDKVDEVERDEGEEQGILDILAAVHGGEAVLLGDCEGLIQGVAQLLHLV
jgi:hypothetical protein